MLRDALLRLRPVRPHPEGGRPVAVGSAVVRITVPLLRRTTILVTVLQILASLKIFDQVFLMTSGGPNLSTRPVLEYVFDLGFTDYRVGYASAASMLLFLLTLAVSLAWLLVIRRPDEEGA
jgi:multiple sugar transport system permease protein